MHLVDLRYMGSDVENGADSVSRGLVTYTKKNKATCKRHGAMLCVSQDRRIWRCPACNVGAYRVSMWKALAIYLLGTNSTGVMHTPRPRLSKPLHEAQIIQRRVFKKMGRPIRQAHMLPGYEVRQWHRDQQQSAHRV